MWQQLVCSNYATCFTILFIIIFLCTNVDFEKKTTDFFMKPTLLALVLVIADSVESWTASLDYYIVLRTWMSAIGYTVRPLCVLYVLRIIVRDDVKSRIILAIPAGINGLIAFSALFTDIAYSYTPDNEFVRGPLGFSTFIVGGFYLALLLRASVIYVKNKNYYEGLIVLAIVLANTISVALEVAFKFEGLLNATIAISIAFYYLYFHTQSYKRDVLTHALNRRCFYLDAERNWEQIKAVISIDLNFLKVINDTQGHKAGDAALCTMGICAEKFLLKGCQFYRVGGDEFSILCTKGHQSQLEDMVQRIKEEMENRNYSCAVGIAMKSEGMDFDSLCTKADKAMYVDKQQMKAKEKEK